MVQKLYALKDEKTGSYGGVLTAINEATIIRDLRFMIDNDVRFKSMVPDYQLFEIGDYDTETGEVIPNHNFVLNLVDLEVK